MSAGRMLDFTTSESCAFPVATQPFILLDRGGHAQIAADSDERCSSLSTHSSAPQTNRKSELPGILLQMQLAQCAVNVYVTSQKCIEHACCIDAKQ